MADLQAKYDEYQSQHNRAPTATQLSKFAGVRYSAASAFLRNNKGSGSASSSNSSLTTRNNRSQTISYQKTSPALTSTQNTRVRTGSFSNTVLFGNEQQQNKSSSSGIDYSGSTTGANNPWKKFQRKSSGSSGFGQSYASSSSYSKPKPKPKPAPKKATSYASIQQRPTSPKQSRTTTTTSSNASATTSAYTYKSPSTSTTPKRTTTTSIYSASSSYSSINRSPKVSSGGGKIDVSGLRADLNKINTNFERECSKIRSQFESMRQDLSRKENEIINNLTNYRNQCKSIIEGNISKLEKLSKSAGSGSASKPASTPKTNTNGYSRQVSNETIDSNDYVQIEQEPEEKEPPSPIYKESMTQSQPKPKVTSYKSSPKVSSIYSPPAKASNSSSGIDYSGSTTGANNPWKKKPQASYSTNKSTPSYTSSYSRPYKSQEVIESNPNDEPEPDPEPEPEPEPQPEAQPTAKVSSIKTFIPKPPSAQKDVESDEWSESENSW